MMNHAPIKTQCDRYDGNCTITPQFCADRHKKAVEEFWIWEMEKCADCPHGIACAEALGIKIRKIIRAANKKFGKKAPRSRFELIRICEVSGE